MTQILKSAAQHRGTALVEIYQNCPIFNDGAFDLIKDRTQQDQRLVRLRAGEPVTVGTEDARLVLVRDGATMRFVPEADALDRDVVVHDPSADDPSQAFALSRLDTPEMTHVPMGIFRQVSRPSYDDAVRSQVDMAVSAAGGPASDDDLAGLLLGRDTWTVA